MGIQNKKVRAFCAHSIYRVTVWRGPIRAHAYLAELDRKNILKFSSTLALLFSAILSMAQSEPDLTILKHTIIEVDTITNKPKEAIPFDREDITLKVYVDNDRIIRGTTTYKLDRNGKKKPMSARHYKYFINSEVDKTIAYDIKKYRRQRKQCKCEKYYGRRPAALRAACKRERKDCRTALKKQVSQGRRESRCFRKTLKRELAPRSIPKSVVSTNFREGEGKGKLKPIYFDLTPLDPGRNYAIEVKYFTLDLNNNLIAIFRKLELGLEDEAEIAFDEMIQANDLARHISWSYFRSHYIFNVASQLARISANVKQLNNDIASQVCTLDQSRRFVISDFLRHYAIGNSLKFDVGSEAIMNSIYEEHKSIIIAFENLEKYNTMCRAFLAGDLAIQNKAAIIYETSTVKKLANVKASQANLDKMILLVKFLVLNNIQATTGSYPILLRELESILAFLNNRTGKVYAKVVAAEQDITGEFYDTFLLYSSQSIAGTTKMFNFYAKNKFSIVPDFGFVFLYNGGDLIDDTSLVPYLGFNINFRPINKHIPFSDLRFKTFKHRMSFMAGVSLTSLDIEGKREDFFSSTSLLTGFGFRVTNEFKVVGGAIWFKSEDTNPLIDSPKLGAAPFAGVSVDLELQTLFGGIKNLFTK